MDQRTGHTTQIQAWLDQIRAGDTAARDQVISHSCERLRKLTRKMLRGFPRLRRWEETDDVLQQAIMRLHASLGEVRPQCVRQFFGLAATQVRRTLIDLSRHHFGPEGHAAKHQTDGGLPAGSDQGHIIDRQPGRSIEPATLEAWTRFHQAVEAMPEAEQEVFSLLWYEGLTQVEAASVLEVTERTVRRRWESARCLLYEALQGEPPE